MEALNHRIVRRMTIGASVVLAAGGIGTAPLAVSASSPTNGSGHSLSATTRFYVPPPAQARSRRSCSC